MAEIDTALMEVADPESKSYGRYWRHDGAFKSFLGASEHASRVERWLREDGHALEVTTTLAGDFVRARLPRAHAERLFQQPLRHFHHPRSGAVRLAADGDPTPSVPSAMRSAIDLVFGFELPRLRQLRPSPRQHARRHGPSLVKGSDKTGTAYVLFTEARDRAFHVHASVLSDVDFSRSVCGGDGAGTNGCGVIDGTAVPVVSFEGMFTPVRLNNTQMYLNTVNLSAPALAGDCGVTAMPGAAAGRNLSQITCTVAFGPSLSLVNFASTRLVIRAVFADGSTSPWSQYDHLVYPALSTTVTDMKHLYHVPRSARNVYKHNSQAIANFMGIGVSEEDAKLFRYAMGIRGQPPVKYVGANAPVGVEGNIDLQWIQAIGDNVPTTSWSTPGMVPAHEPFLEWLVSLANASDPPLVHSVSYGENEEDYTAAYELRANMELAKLGMRGISVLVATGDTGIQGAAQDGGTPPRCRPFAPVWPASSPYVTAVGGTMISSHVSDICNFDRVYSMGTNSSMPFACPEMAIGEIVGSVERGGMITGGGGFSDRFPMPAYQKAAVQEYLDQVTDHGMDFTLFNRSGRAYPDISAVSQNVPVYFQGQLVMVGGTSSSSPIVAGIVALLNGERMASGKPQLGFLNPLLYKLYEREPAIVQDVFAGNNSGGNLLLPPELNRNCPAGFQALAGWDAATGLGTPNYAVMREFIRGMGPSAALDSRSDPTWRGLEERTFAV